MCSIRYSHAELEVVARKPEGGGFGIWDVEAVLEVSMFQCGTEIEARFQDFRDCGFRIGGLFSYLSLLVQVVAEGEGRGTAAVAAAVVVVITLVVVVVVVIVVVLVVVVVVGVDVVGVDVVVVVVVEVVVVVVVVVLHCNRRTIHVLDEGWDKHAVLAAYPAVL